MKRQQKMNLPRDQELRDQPFDEHGASDNDHIIQLSTTNASMQEDWLNFAKAIDRISLICYCAIFAISGLSYCIWFSHSNKQMANQQWYFVIIIIGIEQYDMMLYNNNLLSSGNIVRIP